MLQVELDVYIPGNVVPFDASVMSMNENSNKLYLFIYKRPVRTIHEIKWANINLRIYVYTVT